MIRRIRRVLIDGIAGEYLDQKLSTLAKFPPYRQQYIPQFHPIPAILVSIPPDRQHLSSSQIVSSIYSRAPAANPLLIDGIDSLPESFRMALLIGCSFKRSADWLIFIVGIFGNQRSSSNR